MTAALPTEAPGACANPERLLAFRLGRLSLQDLDALASHLDQCTHCTDFLNTMPAGPDGLLSDLRALRGRADMPDEAALEPEMAAAEAGGFAPAAGNGLPARCQFGEYRLVARLGEGGMGTVYHAVHGRLGKDVALKLLAAHRREEAGMQARFEREMRAVGRLRHPNIVQATDAGEVDGTPFLVMELLEGADLGQVVRRLGRLPIPEACAIARHAAAGLHHAHGQGLVHRDVKPSNLFVTPDGQVKVLDLGLARHQPPDTPAASGTGSDLLLGTADYLAPEQAEDARRVDGRPIRRW
jgi:serine/threonine protein kinase